MENVLHIIETVSEARRGDSNLGTHAMFMVSSVFEMEFRITCETKSIRKPGVNVTIRPLSIKMTSQYMSSRQWWNCFASSVSIGAVTVQMSVNMSTSRFVAVSETLSLAVKLSLTLTIMNLE